MIGFVLFIVVIVLVFHFRNSIGQLRNRVARLEKMAGDSPESKEESRPVKGPEPAPQKPPIPETSISQPKPLAPPPLFKFSSKPEPGSKAEVDKKTAQTSVFIEDSPSVSNIDWEKFTGVKLFAWVGGLALFLGAAFFVKYSIEQDWINPLIRVITGFLAGTGVLALGLFLRGKGYPVTVHTLCASGVAILYTDVFASHAFYNFIGVAPAFALMVLVTVLAFLLAARLDSLYVALLGLIGGFLTPFLLSTGIDQPVALFGYIAVLDVGLVLVALQKRWSFLISLSALATLAVQISWVLQFFTVDKAMIGVIVFLLFPVMYLGFHTLAVFIKRDDQMTFLPAALLPFAGIFYSVYMLAYPELGTSPILVLSFLFLLDALLTAAVVWSDKFRPAHLGAGFLTLVIITVWIGKYLTYSLLPAGLWFILVFSILHAAVPVLMHIRRPGSASFIWGNIYPVLMFIPIAIIILNETTTSFLVWPLILLINGVAVGAALITGILGVITASLLLTFITTGFWLFRLPSTAGLPGFLAVLTFFSLVFMAVGLYLNRRRPEKIESTSPREINLHQITQLPMLSGLSPFLLLAMASVHLSLLNPAPIFGVGLFLTILMLGLVKFQKADGVAPVTFAGVSLMQYAWHLKSFETAQTMTVLPWYMTFFAVFYLYPFVFSKEMKDRFWPWCVSALSGPISFFLMYKVISQTSADSLIGLLPAGFAIFSLAGLINLTKKFSLKDDLGKTVLALFGGVTLLFISLIFPLQFDKEWITLGWAVEGLALVWLYHRIPHSGLKGWGSALLAISFIRLAINPAVFEYHARTALPVFNWYLYAYGTVVICLLMAAKLWRFHSETSLDKRTPSVMNLLATVLAFLLLNIEIADFFSTGTALTFQFSGNLAQDMTYSLGWALFAFGLLLIGLRTGNKAARLGSMGLLAATVIKVFIHDIWRLGQLYRVASFIGLAAVLILVSFLYQRYLSDSKKNMKKEKLGVGGQNDE